MGRIQEFFWSPAVLVTFGCVVQTESSPHGVPCKTKNREQGVWKAMWVGGAKDQYIQGYLKLQLLAYTTVGRLAREAFVLRWEHFKRTSNR